MEKIENPEVAAVFDNYPERMRERLMLLRRLVIDTASETEGVGSLEETLRWGEPSYLSRPHSKSLSSGRFKVLRHGRTSLWLAGFGF